MLFDTHAHLDDKRFDEDREALIEHMHAHGLDYIVNVGAKMKGAKDSVALADKYDFIYAAVGVHPHYADGMTEPDIETLRALSNEKKVVAIGEIGLDFYYDNSDRDAQRHWFSRQLELAREVGLPVIIHNRDAHQDCLDILKEHHIGEVGGVMHCFSGSVEIAKQVIDMGMHISFAGPITFKNSAKLPDVVRAVPLDRIFIETDCPYLTPEPHRGERNNPGYVLYVAQKIAEILDMPAEELAKITKRNAMKFFGIED